MTLIQLIDLYISRNPITQNLSFASTLGANCLFPHEMQRKGRWSYTNISTAYNCLFSAPLYRNLLWNLEKICKDHFEDQTINLWTPSAFLSVNRRQDLPRHSQTKATRIMELRSIRKFLLIIEGGSLDQPLLGQLSETKKEGGDSGASRTCKYGDWLWILNRNNMKWQSKLIHGGKNHTSHVKTPNEKTSTFSLYVIPKKINETDDEKGAT